MVIIMSGTCALVVPWHVSGFGYATAARARARARVRARCDEIS